MATILIATMDSTEFTILSAEVEGEGHAVLWASDGKEAVDQALEHKPAVVFLSAALPIYDGYEVAEILRGDPDIPRALPLLLLSDEAVEPHRFERSGFTEQFPCTHAHHDVREVLARFTPVPPTS